MTFSRPLQAASICAWVAASSAKDVYKRQDLRRPVFALAAQNHWPILSMKNTDLTLEDVFLRLTSDLYDHQETAQPSEILDGKEGA